MDIGDIYQAAADDEAYARLPALVAHHAGARSAIFFRLRQNMSGVEDLAWNYFDSSMIADFTASYWKEHDVWTPLAVVHGRGKRVIACDDYVDKSNFKRSHIYNDLIRQHGDDTTHCMGTVLNVDGDIFGIGLHRPAVSGSFAPSDVARLQRLISHLHRMCSIRTRLSYAGQAVKISQAMLDGLAAPLLRVDGRGRVLFANTAARRLLDRRDGLSERAGRLWLSSPEAQGRLMAALAAISRSAKSGDSFAVPRPGDAAPHRLTVAPFFDGEPIAALVLIATPDAEPLGLRTVLQTSFKLTAAETELALGLLAGMTPDEVAENRGVRVSTVRSQARRLLEKTESRSLTQALAVITRTTTLVRGDLRES